MKIWLMNIRMLSVGLYHEGRHVGPRLKNPHYDSKIKQKPRKIKRVISSL